MDFLYALFNIMNGMSPYILFGFLVAGMLHVFVRQRTMARHLAGSGVASVFKAAMFGIPLPLCSCGVLPAAVSLRRRGASKAASTSFLIATPQTGVDSIAATYSLLGLPFAIVRPLAALAGAFFGGLAVGKLDRENHNTAFIEEDYEAENLGFVAKIRKALKYGFVDMVASVGKWLVAGLLIAALVTVFVPDSFFTGLSRYPVLAMLAVVLVAVPMYVCATGSIPIALSLMLKGLSPGIAFVMLMAGPAANFASILILGRTFGKRATAIYVGSVVVSAIGIGLIIDCLLPASWFVPAAVSVGDSCHASISLWETVCTVIFTGLLLYSFIHKTKHHHFTENDMTQKFNVKGMACAHCKANVERAVSALEGVTAVNVDLEKASLTVEGQASAMDIVKAVELAGYECKSL